MNFGAMYPSKYLKQADCPHPITAIIAKVSIDNVGMENDAENKPVLYFQAGVKPMVLNKSNGFILCEAWGEETDGWIGKAVEIYTDKSVMFKGERTGGLRLRIAHDSQDVPTSWTLEQAVAEAGKKGISRDNIIAALKQAGRNGWQPSRDTVFVQEMMRSVPEQEQSFDTAPETGEVPF